MVSNDKSTHKNSRFYHKQSIKDFVCICGEVIQEKPYHGSDDIFENDTKDALVLSGVGGREAYDTIVSFR